MTEQEQMLRAVLEQPDDNTVRLAYADFLDEHGDGARAAFIRAQVAASHLPGTYWNCLGTIGRPTRFKELVALEPWALRHVMASVLPANSGYLQASSSSAAVFWRRGFIEAVLCSGVSLGPTLSALKAHPVREVRLTNEPPLSLIRRLQPGWPARNLFAYGLDEQDRRLKVLLTTPRAFPTLLHCGFEAGKLSRDVCPFDLAHLPPLPGSPRA